MLAKLGIKKSKSNLNLNSSQALERRNNELFRSHLLDSIARNLSIMHAQGWLTTGDFGNFKYTFPPPLSNS